MFHLSVDGEPEKSTQSRGLRRTKSAVLKGQPPFPFELGWENLKNYEFSENYMNCKGRANYIISSAPQSRQYQ
jgi:hypothetical protein